MACWTAPAAATGQDAPRSAASARPIVPARRRYTTCATVAGPSKFNRCCLSDAGTDGCCVTSLRVQAADMS